MPMTRDIKPLFEIEKVEPVLFDVSVYLVVDDLDDVILAELHESSNSRKKSYRLFNRFSLDLKTVEILA